MAGQRIPALNTKQKYQAQKKISFTFFFSKYHLQSCKTIKSFHLPLKNPQPLFQIALEGQSSFIYFTRCFSTLLYQISKSGIKNPRKSKASVCSVMAWFLLLCINIPNRYLFLSTSHQSTNVMPTFAIDSPKKLVPRVYVTPFAYLMERAPEETKSFFCLSHEDMIP